MESAVATVESSPIVTQHKKPIQSAVETVESPSTVSEGKEPTPSAVEDKDVTIVSESKKTTPSVVETADSDVTIISESKKTTPSAVETADSDVTIILETKKTTPAVETADNDDVTIISESKKPTTAQLAVETVENASIISESSSHEGHRLWIGNIDPKITEYHLVKLLEKFGKVKQFDFLFHKSGPLEGQPRGYCFVNFHTKEEAERAIHCLNGKLALSKKLVVRWAHAQVHIASLTLGDVVRGGFERNECTVVLLCRSPSPQCLRKGITMPVRGFDQKQQQTNGVTWSLPGPWCNRKLNGLRSG